MTDEDIKEANTLASDAILNYKIVQSFACEDTIVSQYSSYYEKKYKLSIKKANMTGFLYGMTQAINNCVFPLLMYLGIYLRVK